MVAETIDLVDPWAPAAPERRGRQRGHELFRLVLAWVLAVFFPAAVVWNNGSTNRQGAWLLIAAGAVWTVLLPVDARRHGPNPLWPVLGVASLAAALPVFSTIGRAPALVTVGFVIVWRAALVGWAPLRSWPERRSPVAALAVPVALLAGVSWYRVTSVPVTLGLQAVALALVELTHRFPERIAGPEAWLDRAVRAVGLFVAHVIMAIVALPLIYLPGAIARVVHAVGRRVRPRPTAWRDPSPGSTRVRDVRYPFASPPARVARRRNLTGLVVLVLVAGVFVWARADHDGTTVVPTGGATTVAGTAVPVDDGSSSIADKLDKVPFSQRPAMADADYADALQQETYQVQLVEDPVSGYVPADRDGELLSVTDGMRTTIASPCRGCPTTRLFLSGGSQVFGIGQRDAHTIGSELVRLAAEDGVNLDLLNLGVPGWTLTQQGADLEDRFARSPRSADVVVFLDGFNDVIASLGDLQAEGELPPTPALLDPERAEALLDPPEPVDPDDAAAAGALAGARYASAADQLDGSLRAGGIDVFRFFQPDASSSEVQRDAVDALGVLPEDFYGVTQLDAAFSAATDQLGDDTTNLRDLFDDADEPVFIDTSHVNERGARDLAEAMYRELRPVILERAR